MELLLSFIAIILYALDFKLASGVLGCISVLLFLFIYSKGDDKYKVFIPWIIIAVLLNVFYIHYEPNFILSIGITGAASIWITSLIVWILHSFFNY